MPRVRAFGPLLLAATCGCATIDPDIVINPAARTTRATLMQNAKVTSSIGRTTGQVSLYEADLSGERRLAIVLDRGIGERALVLYVPARFEAAAQARRIVFASGGAEAAFELPSAERIQVEGLSASEGLFSGLSIEFDMRDGTRRVLAIDADFDDEEGSVAVESLDLAKSSWIGTRATRSESAVFYDLHTVRAGDAEVWVATVRPAPEAPPALEPPESEAAPVPDSPSP